MASLAAARGERRELPKSSVALPCSSLGTRVHLWLQQWRRSRRWMFLLHKGAGCHKATCYIPIFPPLMFRDINMMLSSQLRRLNPAQALYNTLFFFINSLPMAWEMSWWFVKGLYRHGQGQSGRTVSTPCLWRVSAQLCLPICLFVAKSCSTEADCVIGVSDSPRKKKNQDFSSWPKGLTESVIKGNCFCLSGEGTKSFWIWHHLTARTLWKFCFSIP